MDAQPYFAPRGGVAAGFAFAAAGAPVGALPELALALLEAAFLAGAFLAEADFLAAVADAPEACALGRGRFAAVALAASTP